MEWGDDIVMQESSCLRLVFAGWSAGGRVGGGGKVLAALVQNVGLVAVLWKGGVSVRERHIHQSLRSCLKTETRHAWLFSEACAWTQSLLATQRNA